MRSVWRQVLRGWFDVLEACDYLCSQVSAKNSALEAYKSEINSMRDAFGRDISVRVISH